MAYNNGLAKKLFLEQWAQQEHECRAAGMCATDIQELHDFEWAQFKRDRAFYEHTDTYEDLLTQSAPEHPSDWLDEINNQALTAQIDALSDGDKKVLTLLVGGRYTHAEIAEALGVTRQAIYKRMARIKASFVEV
ncbi:MAG: HTH domain-containing protein [Oscillospiraceae bacterium]|jgi:DNA-directed RNA polymerase specialized sigma24 family protein|nr:HTH domain-containing protein [Oscillospiraceae bacterium]